MHVMGHQHVGVHRAFGFPQRRLAQPVQVARVVVLGKETWLTIVTTLHDMQSNAIEVGAGATWHAAILSDKASLAPFMHEST